MNKKLKTKLERLPQSPGVYFFKDKDGKNLYIGKASSIRTRVKSYFLKNLILSRGAWLVKMLEEVRDIDFEKTDSVLEALLLEARLIKKYKPRFNTKEKDDKSFSFVFITKEDFPVVSLVRERDLLNNKKKFSEGYVFGPFPKAKLLKEGLNIIRKIFPFRDEKCYLSKSKIKRPCFNYQLGLCPGVCVGEISSTEYKKNIINIRLFFQGKKNKVISNLEKQRDTFSKKLKFEKADKTQKKINALKHIKDVSLLKNNDFESFESYVFRKKRNKKSFRVEGYDVSHLAGTYVVGVFSVVEDSKIIKEHYRKFRIKNSPGINDTKALEEVLIRRMNHREWRLPDIIVVDGGIAQRNVASAVLKKNNKSISVVAVLKDKNHRPFQFLGNMDLINKYKKEIVLANTEAHRFAVSYHRSLREKIK
jgi:excinuclease ABC subunit C